MTAEKLRFEPTIGPLGGRAVVDERPAPMRAPRRVVAKPDGRPPQLLAFAAAYVVVGLLCGGLIVSGAASQQDASALGLAWPYSALFLCVVTTLAGALLMAGQPIGWYLATLVVVDAMLAAAWEAQTLILHQAPLSFWFESSLSGYARASIKAAVAGAVLLYLLSDAIRDFCAMQRARAYLAVVLLLALELALLMLESPLQLIIAILRHLPA